MKLTNLDYVQSILSSLGSDEVNSVSDTTESLQVLEIVKQTYFNIVSRAELKDQKKPFQLDPSLTVLEPNLMFIPSNIKSMEWIKYYKTSSAMYNYVTMLPIQQFVDYVNGYNPSDVAVDVLSLVVEGETFLFNYKNNVTPHYCTVLSNFYVVFDSYDAAVDSTLQASKTMCYGLTTPTWEDTDDFIPLLDEQQVSLLLNEAKSLAFLELKQLTHAKAEQEAKRQWGTIQKNKSTDNKPSYFDQLPDFGRKPPSRRGPQFRWS